MIVLQIIMWLDALFFQAPSPPGMGRALCARGGAAPLSPEGFLLHPIQRYTHTNSNHKKSLLQLGKNISPTRKIEKHTPANIANPANLANIGLGMERVRSWYGEGLGSHPLFYFVLFCSSCSKT